MYQVFTNTITIITSHDQSMVTNDGGAGGGYVTRFLSAARAYVVVHEWRNWLFQCLIYSEVCCHSPSDRLAAHTSRSVIFVSLVSLYLFVVEDRVANCALYRASVLNFECDIGTVLIIRSRNTHHVYVRVFHLISRIISQVGFYKFSYKLVYFISFFEMFANGERVTSCEPDWLVEPLMHCSLT